MDDARASDLLAAKWIVPLVDKLNDLAEDSVDGCISKLRALIEKYATTYADVCDEIASTEAELLGMLDDLTGNEFDMAGIAELKRLLGGE